MDEPLASYLFGDRTTFAIQVEFTDFSRWLNGRLCFWIGGVAFGDVTASVTLGPFISDFIQMAKDSGQRSDPALAGVSDDAIFEAIRSGIYEDDNPIVLDTPARFDITPSTYFGARCCYAVQDGDRYRLLVGDFDRGLERVFICRSNAVDDVFFDAFWRLRDFDQPDED